MDIEIDIGRFIEIIIHRFRLLILVFSVCVIIALLVSIFTPTRFRSRVLVATIKTTTEVSLDTAIKTLSEEQLGAVGSAKQRMASFAALVENAGIAEAVLSQIGDQLPGDVRQPQLLLRLVDGSLASGSDLVEIGVTHTDPQVATLLANVWGREYVRQVNLIYADVADESLLAIQQEKQAARDAYDRDQSALEAALREHRSAELERRIAELEGAIEASREARSRELRTLLDKTQIVDGQLDVAHDLLAQIQAGGTPAADTAALALRLFKVTVYANAPEGESVWTLQVDASQEGTNPSDMTRDLEGMISSLGLRQMALEEQLSQRLTQAGMDQQALPSTSALARIDGFLPDLEQLLRDLESELEHERKSLRKISNRRNLSQQTHEMLLRKEAELTLASQNKGAEVRLAAPALVATEEGLGLVFNLAIGAIVGAALGVLSIIFAENWHAYRERALGVTAADDGQVRGNV